MRRNSKSTLPTNLVHKEFSKICRLFGVKDAKNSIGWCQNNNYSIIHEINIESESYTKIFRAESINALVMCFVNSKCEISDLIKFLVSFDKK